MWSIIKRILLHPYKLSTFFWKSKTPFGKLRSLYNFIKFFGCLLQMEIFTRHPNGPIIYLIISTGVVTYFLLFYTTYFYIYNGDFFKCIRCYCMFGLLTSVSFYFFISIRKIIMLYSLYQNVTFFCAAEIPITHSL